MDLYDQYRDWQLDVDNMSYEVLNFLLYMALFFIFFLCIIESICFPFLPLKQELLELGDRIGHVSTGLKEEEIIGSLRKVKHSFFYALKRFFSTEIDGKCSICQVLFLATGNYFYFLFFSMQLFNFPILFGTGRI